MANTKKTNTNPTDAVRTAINLLRPVDGFVPSDHMIELPPFPGAQENETRLYLEVQWRLQWFLLYCQQHDIEAAVLELDPTFHFPSGYVTASCEVVMNGKVVGRGVGGIDTSRYLRPEYGVQMAETIAKGRALANAGFGTLASSSTSESGGREEPCDSGISAALNFQRSPENPMMAAAMAPAPASARPERKAKTVAPAPAEEAKVMTREDALRVTSPKGEVLGDLIAKSPRAVQYYANNANYAGTVLQAAAKLVLGQEG